MTDDLNNLALCVKARREARDWTQHDVWSRGGPSNSTLTAVESGRPPGPSRSTLRKLDAGLDWVPGSAKVALAGGQPTAAEDSTQPTLLSPPPGSQVDIAWHDIEIALQSATPEQLATELLRRTGQPTAGQLKRAELDSLGEENQDPGNEEPS